MLLGACSQGLESDSKHGFAKTSNLFKMMVIIVIVVVVVILVFVGVFCVHIVCCWCPQRSEEGIDCILRTGVIDGGAEN